METTTKKKLGWLLFCCGLFMTALAVVLIIALTQLGPPGQIFKLVFGLGIAGPASLVSSLLWLRHSYRIEPAQRPGKWQLSLADCLLATGFAAVWMAAWRGFSPGNFLATGAACSFVAGIWLLVSMLTAARLGFEVPPVKWVFALGLALKSYGYVCWGIFIPSSIMLLLTEGPAAVLKYWDEVFVTPVGDGGTYYVMFARLSLLAPLFGYALCAIARVKNRKPS